MAMYLRNLHFWFLLGPIITMVWLRRKKILCRVTTARQIDEESGDEEIVEVGRGHSIQRDLIFTYHAQTSSIPVRVARIFGRIYNVTCTVCNFLFIIILNKHKVVTRYVFYISVCMICAYAESDIVAVFYFILNSQGSLNNLKLTALRTVALGLTLNLSFSSSMHIIRKLMKPQESVFEGLSER
nr:uncharacterized protein LOC131770423 [Pocillopora verrucosa]